VSAPHKNHGERAAERLASLKKRASTGEKPLFLLKCFFRVAFFLPLKHLWGWRLLCLRRLPPLNGDGRKCTGAM
jgi:hypothetical protein